jgi:hypothetical protein
MMIMRHGHEGLLFDDILSVYDNEVLCHNDNRIYNQSNQSLSNVVLTCG